MQIKQTRQPHATLELQSRRPKAQKIEQLLELSNLKQPINMLEIGCGSGGIAHYFATHPILKIQVTAIDTHDNRQIHDGYMYYSVKSTELPFDNDSFDVVITNHVIEHVGQQDSQIHHLKEIRRVLKPNGVGYLAAPNRWMVTEPHYRLKFLSWLPRYWRTPYLRLMRKGDFYDCEPLALNELEKMLRIAKLNYRNICLEGLRTTFNLEQPNTISNRILHLLPDSALSPLVPLIPTLIYRIQR
jgi:SAM-dependent methyltransferase